MGWVTSVKRSTLKSKVRKHYRDHFALHDMGIACNDREMIEWAVQMVADLFPETTKQTDK